MVPKGVTLRGLEVFEAVAATGTVAAAAERTGLSKPAVSQQMKNLEAALGVALVDHTRRPMQVTQAGKSFLARTQTILGQLRAAQSELTVMDLAHLQTLSLGVIDDFDNNVTPRLVTILADAMTQCRFKLITAPSHEIAAALQTGALDVAVAASGGEHIDGAIEYPLARDPFVMVCPKGAVAEKGGAQAVCEALPFLRYDRAQVIGRLIEAQVQRLGLTYPERFEIGAHLSLMTLVARGAGWAITTPLGYMRAVRVHEEIEAHPLPPPWEGFARSVVLYASADWVSEVPRDIARTLRGLISDMAIEPALQKLPWLEGDLVLQEEQG